MRSPQHSAITVNTAESSNRASTTNGGGGGGFSLASIRGGGGMISDSSTAGGIHHQHPSVERNLASKRSRRRNADGESNHTTSTGGGGGRSSRRNGGGGPHKSNSEKEAEEAEAVRKSNAITEQKHTISLLVILFAESFIIVVVFVVLIAVSSVRMSETTRSLVEERIKADLLYTHASVKNPIDSNEKVIKAQALRYNDMTLQLGREYCSETSNEFNASTDFFCDALSVLESHPMLAYIYTVKKHPYLETIQLNTRTGVTGPVRAITECGLGSDYLYTRSTFSNDEYRYTTDPLVNISGARGGFRGLNEVVDDTYPFDNYVFNGGHFTDFGWWPFLWIDQDGGAILLLGGYAPLLVNRTVVNTTADPYAPSVPLMPVTETFSPDLSVPKELKVDPSLTSVSFIAGDLMMAHMNELLNSVTPATDGAHTSMYDLRSGSNVMLSTTDTSIHLYDELHHMWPAGKTGSAAINAAFNELRPEASPHNPTALTANDGIVTVRFTNHHVISSIRISGASGIDFIVIQSTPLAFYMSEVTQLRMIMIVLGVIAAMVVVSICVGMVLMIRSTISNLQEGMHLAALLKNDRVVLSRSVMTELDHLCIAFAKMNAKLGAARAFMPQSMLLTDTDPETEGDHNGGATERASMTEGDAYTRSSGGGGGGGSHGKKGGAHAFYNDDESSVVMMASSDDQGPHANNNGRRGGGHHHQQNNPWQSESGLAVKRVTMLCINARSFHKISSDSAAAASAGLLGVGGGGGPSITTLTSELTSAIQSLAATSRGVIDSFHGDHFVISFNAAKTNAQGPAMAVQCATDIQTAFGGGSYQQHNQSFPRQQRNYRGCLNASSSASFHSGSGPAIAFSMGIATGRAAVGHLGSNDLKRFSIIGKVFSRAHALERICKQLAEEEIAAETVKLLVAGSGKKRTSSLIAAEHSNHHQSSSNFVSSANNYNNSNVTRILIDSTVAPDIEHAYYLQVMGKVSEASLVSVCGAAAMAAAATIKNSSSARLSAANPLSDSNNQETNRVTTTTTVAPNTASTSIPATASLGTEAILYAVKGSTDLTSADHGGDEWLYEIKQEGGGDGKEIGAMGDAEILPSVNKAVVNFLSQVGPRAAYQQLTASAAASSSATLLMSNLLFPPTAMAVLSEALQSIESRCPKLSTATAKSTTAASSHIHRSSSTHHQSGFAIPSNVTLMQMGSTVRDSPSAKITVFNDDDTEGENQENSRSRQEQDPDAITNNPKNNNTVECEPVATIPTTALDDVPLPPSAAAAAEQNPNLMFGQCAFRRAKAMSIGGEGVVKSLYVM